MRGVPAPYLHKLNTMAWKDDITDKITRRVPELGERANEDLLDDLLDDAFRSIIIYSNANAYKKEWDGILVRCVAMLYNNIGVEGSVGRNSLSTYDSFDSTDIIASFIQRNIPQYIRPVGYKYSDTRFDYPED